MEILIDTGGTFTDGVLVDEERGLSTAKFPTDAVNPSESIMGCIAHLAKDRQLTVQDLLSTTTTLVVGTTLPTNALVEEKGAKCCLIHTRGFRDIPELGRTIPKVDVYNMKLPPPKPLVPRYLRFGVEERVRYDGGVLQPLNEEDVIEAVRRAKKEDVEVPVVCFLHSYINPAHEERAAEIIKTEYPNVVVSSRILRRWIEYDRASTAMIAAYVAPITNRFVRSLEERVKSARFKGTLLFITCAGGVAAPELCLENPGLLIGSGPAAGSLLGQFVAESAGFENAIVCDMGGTSFDVSMLPKRMIITTTEQVTGQHRNALEAVDVTSMGAGGGSIAWIDERGMLMVGPSSVGADPGPACYGKGGRGPTVTDADVVLGRIPPDYFLGGSILLDVGLAETAIEERIARPLGLETVEAAHMISSLTEANMAERIFLTAVKKGLDPRDFTLVVGGGAGPVHAIFMALRLGIKQVYIPKLAGVFCALGMGIADYKYTLSHFLLCNQDEVDLVKVKRLYNSLEEEGMAILRRQGVREGDVQMILGAEIRYSGQLRPVEVLLPAKRPGKLFTNENFTELIKDFHERHEALYGWSDATMPVTIGTLRLQATGARRRIDLGEQSPSGENPSEALRRSRRVYFDEMGGFVETPCYDGDRLKYGNTVAGPAIIEETQTTVVIPQGCVVTVDAYDNYVVRRSD